MYYFVNMRREFQPVTVCYTRSITELTLGKSVLPICYVSYYLIQTDGHVIQCTWKVMMSYHSFIADRHDCIQLGVTVIKN